MEQFKKGEKLTPKINWIKRKPENANLPDGSEGFVHKKLNNVDGSSSYLFLVGFSLKGQDYVGEYIHPHPSLEGVLVVGAYQCMKVTNLSQRGTPTLSACEPEEVAMTTQSSTPAIPVKSSDSSERYNSDADRITGMLLSYSKDLKVAEKKGEKMDDGDIEDVIKWTRKFKESGLFTAFK